MNQSGIKTLSRVAMSVALAVAGVAVAGTMDADLAAMKNDRVAHALRLALSAPASEKTDHLIIKYKNSPAKALSNPSVATQASVLAGVSLKYLHATATGGHVLKLDSRMPVSEVAQIAARLAKDPNVLYVEPDYMRQINFTPDDPMYGDQWGYQEPLSGINAPAAWEKAKGNGAVVAVLDTGKRKHPDLLNVFLPGYDMIYDPFVARDRQASNPDVNDRDDDPTDVGDFDSAGVCTGIPRNSSWHGTHVTGTIAANTNNGVGVSGVAFMAKVVPVRVLGRCGGYTSDIADGILWAAGFDFGDGTPVNANPAHVLNMSLGGYAPEGCDFTSQLSISMARWMGTTIVASAGNSDLDASSSSPSNCGGVINVSALTQQGSKAFFSNYRADISAPGYLILSTLNDGTTTPGNPSYAVYSGTSMAAPHVTGTVALLKGMRAKSFPEQIESLLKNTARAPNRICFQCGAGDLDAAAAVNGMATLPLPLAEVEPNDTFGSGQALDRSGRTYTGTLSDPADWDWYNVYVPAGATVTLDLAFPPLTSDFALLNDYDLVVFDQDGQVIKTGFNGYSTPEEITLHNHLDHAQTLAVRVQYYDGGTGDVDGKYRLTIGRR